METQVHEPSTAISDATVSDATLSDATRDTPLFGADELGSLRARWERIQTEFVDEPRRSVEQADDLVCTVAKRLTEVFGDERNRLEQAWDKGHNVSTEDLRMTLRRYRSLFERLLSI